MRYTNELRLHPNDSDFVRSYIETFLIRVWKPLHSRHVLKQKTQKRESPKKTRSASHGLGFLLVLKIG